MKFLAVFILALATTAYSRNIDLEDFLQDNTAYGYYGKIGMKLAEDIRQYEEELMSSRIVGGSAASAGQFPYQAGLLANFAGGQGVCGGVIVSNRKILTAAHCWWDGQNQANSLTVVVGTTTLFFGGTRVTTSNVVMHANWTPILIRNDIAMITVATALALNANTNIVALPSGNQLNEDFVGDVATASGFGRTADGASGGITTAQSLRHVDLPVITNTECLRTFWIIQASNLCTSGAGGRSTCNGDSGGPLVVTRNNNRILIGLTSFGSANGCQINAPAAFVRVTSFMPWINSNM